MKTFEEVASFIRQHEVGRRACIDTPFGRRLLCYADLTATGRYLHFVEAWIRRARPFYANSHTAVSSTGRVMTELREQARQVVRRSVNAGPDDVALFVGAGATAAVNKLVGLLGLRISEPLEREFGLSKHIPQARRPVVFVGPYEHHSNQLPWLESIAQVVEIGLTDSGAIDLKDLATKLQAHASRPLKIGAFSAASNVTGILTDVKAVARTLHAHGAYACFDYAAAAPYVPIDMHPANPDERLDAVYLSPHKFMGGPHGSGLLIAHKDLFRTNIPERPGGGTVEYVAAFEHLNVDYTHRLDEREEGGTPAIMSDLRAGVAFLAKDMLGAERIYQHEVELAAMALKRLGKHPRIQLLGPTDHPRLAILSFNIEGLHHDLASVLLDHLFGIQNRAGCSCAGPYGHRLLGIDEAKSDAYRAQIARGVGGAKPGWLRLSLPYYASEEDVEFILQAVEFVAEHGHQFIPAYRLGWLDGVWRHIDKPTPDVQPIELTVEALLEAAQSFAAGDHEAPMSEAQIRAERKRYFTEAHALVKELSERWKKEQPKYNTPTGVPEVDGLVWFKYVHTDSPWATLRTEKAPVSCGRVEPLRTAGKGSRAHAGGLE
jgi:selenocysteine lyase/cysteine desulfurase